VVAIRFKAGSMKSTAQPQLEAIAARPVCAARERDQVCTLLTGHACRHRSSAGREWSVAKEAVRA
jgi:hypothetical protein